MRRIAFSLIALCLFSTVIDAQEFIVEKVAEISSEEVAAIDPREDLNGDPCAALIVECLSVDNIFFSGNIIGDVERKNDTYLLYITEGTKRIKLMHEDYFPATIEFLQYGTTIKGGHMYKVVLNAKNPMVGNSTYNNGAQYLILKSSVPLTKAIVNGEEWDIIDGKAKKLVPLGRYEYVVEAGNMQSTGVAEVKSTATSNVVNIKFE